MERIKIEFERVPRGVCDDLARCLLERVTAYFEQPEAEAAFQAWLKEYRKRKPVRAAGE